MVKKIIKTNPNLIELINKLNKKSKTENAAIWKDVANRLGRSNRRTAEVNLSDIARYANAEASQKVNEVLANVQTKSNSIQIDSIERKIQRKESLAQGLGELRDIDNFESEFEIFSATIEKTIQRRKLYI